ncbi:hypothetical protein [Halalkalibacillus halophilus]|uniref:hypothetical protein n=1 Tax=Halalkalibacillus halophilus TaxID=392827 RepID=UPI0003F82D8C|nr:hypothetical protein [Halalkalibacillus halophilus]
MLFNEVFMHVSLLILVVIAVALGFIFFMSTFFKNKKLSYLVLTGLILASISLIANGFEISVFMGIGAGIIFIALGIGSYITIKNKQESV